MRQHKSPAKFHKDDKSRWNSVLEATKGLKELGNKAVEGDEEATKEVAKRFNTLYEHSTSIADDAGPMLKKLEGKKLNPEAQKHLEGLKQDLAKWKSLVPKLEKAKGRNPRAQLNHGQDMVELASDIRTKTHWLLQSAGGSLKP